MKRRIRILLLAISSLFFIWNINSIRVQSDATTAWNFMIYIVANNDLYKYAIQNIQEMQKMGSNKNVCIFVQIDHFGKREVLRYKIEKGAVRLISHVKTPPSSISGTKENLFTFVEESLNHNKAYYNALILWNHGSGIKDPAKWQSTQMINRNNAFKLNRNTNMLEIDESKLKGIGFNYIVRTYLTNNALKETLSDIKTKILNNKKLDIIGMDACYMSMIEICTQIREYAKYFVASQELEPGSGWDYSEVLKPLETKNLKPLELANHIVDSYGKRYNEKFSGLTQSSIDLEKIESAEKRIDELSKQLISILNSEHKNHIIKSLSIIRSSTERTKAFYDKDYIDLVHFYKKLREIIEPKKSNSYQKLKKILTEGIKDIEACIIRNSTGKQAENANGLSIYFPIRQIHYSYDKNDFSKQTNWCKFLYELTKK